MMQLTSHMRILVNVEPVDFRKGIDGLCYICREVLLADPMSGAVFVFRNRKKTSIKLLAYDGQGFWLFQKRLSSGRFKHWPHSPGRKSRVLLAHELAVLIVGGDPETTQAMPQWKALNTAP